MIEHVGEPLQKFCPGNCDVTGTKHTIQGLLELSDPVGLGGMSSAGVESLLKCVYEPWTG